MRDAARIGRLFEKHVEEVDAGFGIDQLHLRATRVEKLPFQQMSQQASQNGDKLADLITRLGSRVGLENITRYLPAESHIPERGFLIAPAAYSEPAGRWPHSPPRPLRFFPPEPIATSARRGGVEPPPRFRWHAMSLSKARATGPERIAPEWWRDDPAWRSGVRDYWRVETHQGRRLWLFHTPQNPSWFVHGEFA
ncbi:MAG: hypothetical protein GTN90_01345 [Xanthomonadales bacterium]|nr:hypothetical protein [Xanthomonadales bacterium]